MREYEYEPEWLRKKTRQKISEFRVEYLQEVAECRARYIDNRVADVKAFQKRATSYNWPFWLFKAFWDLREGDKWLRLGDIKKRIPNGKNSISPGDIEQARAYPWENLLEFKNGKAFCPFHEDRRHPNFSVKDSKGKCWACLWRGDQIDYIQQRNGLSFPEAVKFLGGI